MSAKLRLIKCVEPPELVGGLSSLDKVISLVEEAERLLKQVPEDRPMSLRTLRWKVRGAVDAGHAARDANASIARHLVAGHAVRGLSPSQVLYMVKAARSDDGPRPATRPLS